MVRKVLATLVFLFVVGQAGPGFADIVKLKNGREIVAPIVLDTHGLLGPVDSSNHVIPDGKVRLVWTNGWMDIPANQIKELKREDKNGTE